jgi:hypothetical protein
VQRKWKTLSLLESRLYRTLGASNSSSTKSHHLQDLNVFAMTRPQDYFAGLWDFSWPSPLDGSSPELDGESWLDLGDEADASSGARSHRSWLDLGSPRNSHIDDRATSTSDSPTTKASDALSSKRMSWSSKRISWINLASPQRAQLSDVEKALSLSEKDASLASSDSETNEEALKEDAAKEGTAKEGAVTEGTAKDDAPKGGVPQKAALPPPKYSRRESWPVLLGSFCALFASFGWRSGRIDC